MALRPAVDFHDDQEGTTMHTTNDYPVIHRACGKPHRPLTPCPLTRDQLDGLACVGCGSLHGAMRPVGTVDGCQVFAHDGCDEGGDLTNH